MEKRTETYTPHTLEILKRTLEKLDELGEPKFYAVQVDGQTVISRTNNPSEIERVRGFLFHNTGSVKITYYRGYEGEAVEEITYELKAENDRTLAGLAGEIDERIRQAVTAERKNWEHEQLKRDLSETRKNLNDAEEYIDNLEELVEELKSSKNKLGNVHVGEVVSVMVESFMRRNVDKIRKLPGGSTLAGILTAPDENSEPQKETEASFEKAEESTSWWDDVESAFTENEVNCIKAIVAYLSEDKTKIATVLSLVQPQSN